ncbi:MAG: acyltransferase family protein [Ignavibacteriaceae bacterium]|nr:acyltransferase family protein [Ignavibacteriaceae bacterium]
MKTAERNLNIEIIRIIASFGVIVIHVHSDTYGAQFISLLFSPICVPFFLAVSLIFFVQSLGKYSVEYVLTKIWERIGIPYISWTIIYLILLYFNAYLNNSTNKVFFGRSILFGESAVQMYYLITLISLQLFILGVHTLRKTRSRYYFFLSLGLILVTTTYFLFSLYYQASGFRNSYYIVGYLLYIVFAMHYQSSFSSSKYLILPYLCILFVFIVILLSVYDLWGLRKFGPLIFPVCGICLYKIAISYPTIKVPSWIKEIMSLSYGIYLSHVVFLELMEIIAKKITGSEITYTLINKLLLALVVFIISAIFVLLLKRVGILRILLLGERK